MRRKGGLVLAAQKHGDLRRQAAQHHTLRVDHIPGALDIGRLGHIRIHGKTLQCEMVHSRRGRLVRAAHRAMAPGLGNQCAG